MRRRALLTRERPESARPLRSSSTPTGPINMGPHSGGVGSRVGGRVAAGSSRVGGGAPTGGVGLPHYRLSNASPGESNHSTNTVMTGATDATTTTTSASRIFDDPATVQGYESVPLLDIDALPRGGISIETQAVGRIQFGIPPETIKDSMLLGIEVPSVYIVPVERFCREMGPALGINLAEFEFPAYFNYFVRGKKCRLVVDSYDAEKDICNVFGETLLGPEIFRNHDYPCPNLDEDFDPSYPKDARPNFYKEFYNFRTAEESTNYEELTIDTLLEFCHFKAGRDHLTQQQESDNKLGVPPQPAHFELAPPDAPLERLDDMELPPIGSPRLLRNKSNESADATKRALQRWNSESSASGGHHRSSTGTTEHKQSSTAAKLSLSSHRSQERRGSLTAAVELSISQHNRRRSSMPLAAQDVASPTAEGKRDSNTSGNFFPPPKDSLRLSDTAFLGTPLCPYEVVNPGDEIQENTWLYSQAMWLGDVATVYPAEATEEQKKSNATARVEIFRMAGGTEYIIHDVDENNIIIGKARVSGTVRVPDLLSLQGFISNEGLIQADETFHGGEDDEDSFNGDDSDDDKNVPKIQSAPQHRIAPTFYPPSFGVTVLGNSHGFDKNGSTSGYVLWVNGRGIMIDPPPYSSATLEREGIRPQMIMAIIITHCHADHDAGAFQKVMTGARVAIITTPTIYKSFIRKYSSLSGLRQTLLRHSHRHRPAIVGQPLHFQGAVFHFTYTLHTIPCISFRVEWRGRSIVFTGDHMNIPSKIDEFEEKGVLSKARADTLRHLPIQDCDVLLHEAGVPPIHTPLSVLQELPEHVKKRLYIVHTAAIPKDSGLKSAPTGTAGTLRLDRAYNSKASRSFDENDVVAQGSQEVDADLSAESFQDGANQNLSILGSYDALVPHMLASKFDGKNGRPKVAPLVFLRPTDVSDAWFILNLLSAVPFLSSLSFAHTMEVLEIATVEMHCSGEVVIEASRRHDVLCVVWEGTCVERGPGIGTGDPTVWHAGDWTGPVSLQPNIKLSASTVQGEILGDIVAFSEEGVKVIKLMMNDLKRIFKNGSKLFRKYAASQQQQRRAQQQFGHASFSGDSSGLDPSRDNVLDVIQCNSVLKNISAFQKRYLESLAEGPRFFSAESFLWKIGDPVDYAYIIAGGTATLVGRQIMMPRATVSRMARRGSTGAISSSLTSIDESNNRQHQERQLQSMVEGDKLLKNVHPNSEYARLEVNLRVRQEEMEVEYDDVMMEQSLHNMFQNDVTKSHNDRFANKVLARLYSRRAYTEKLVFSKGMFLSDISRMVSGDLANIHSAPGMGIARSSITNPATSTDHHLHASNMVAGPRGCVVFIFPRATLVPFLDSNPGLLMSLLGTQAVV